MMPHWNRVTVNLRGVDLTYLWVLLFDEDWDRSGDECFPFDWRADKIRPNEAPNDTTFRLLHFHHIAGAPQITMDETAIIEQHIWLAHWRTMGTTPWVQMERRRQR